MTFTFLQTAGVKRTKLRSSPEDEAFYRRYHDSALAGVRQGRTADEVTQELLTRGVPAETAKKIVWAVQHEFAQSTFKPGARSRHVRLILVVCAVFMFVTLGLLGWTLFREGASVVSIVIAIVIVMVLGGVAFGRLALKMRGPTDLHLKD